MRTWDSTTGVQATVSNWNERLGSMVFDKNGNLFSVAPDSGSILQLSPGGLWSVLATGLNQPYYLAGRGEGGALYASRFSSGVITKIDSNGSFSDFAEVPEMVTGLVCDEQGAIYATGGRKVFAISPSGSVSTFADFAAEGWSNAYTAYGITRSAGGSMYLARHGDTSFVYALSQQGVWQNVGGHPSGLPMAFQVAVDDSDRIFVYHVWSPFAGSSQISSVTTGASIGYSGFNVGGIAVRSAAVPEPGTVSVVVAVLAAFGASQAIRCRRN